MNNHSDQKHITAAGIILFRNKFNHPVFLGLVALPKFRKQNKGKYDIPKGRLDPGETPIEAAFRECLEESGVTPDRIIAGPFVDGPMAVWLGETSEETINISKNPATGETEHEGYVWLKPPVLRKNCLDYLVPSLEWAEKTIWEYYRQ